MKVCNIYRYVRYNKVSNNINNKEGLKNKEVDKKSDVVVKIKEWVDKEYENERQTSITTGEIVELVEKYSDIREK